MEECGLVLLTLITSAWASYVLNTTRVTWNVANNTCTLATPPVSFESNTIQLDITVNTPVWLGYVKLYRIFQPIGCIKKSAVNDALTSKISAVIPSPGQCHSSCEEDSTQYFGLTDISATTPTCYCFRNNIVLDADREPNCAFWFNDNANVPSGDGNVQDQYISLYRHSTFVGPKRPTLRLCRYWDGNTKLRWAQCTNRYLTMCTMPNGSTVNYGQHTWQESVEKCVQLRMYPVNNSNSINAELKRKRVWIAQFRDYVIKKEAAVPPNSPNKDFYGYMDHGNGTTYNLRFITSKTMHMFLCENEWLSTTNSIASSTGYGKHTTTQSLYSSTNTAIHISESGHTTGSFSDTNTEQLTEDSPQVASYVGIAVGVLVLMVLIGGLILLWRKRRNRPRKEINVANATNNTAYSDTSMTLSVTPPDRQVHAYETLDNKDQMTTYDRISSGVIDGAASDEYTYISPERLNQSTEDEGQYAQNDYHILEKENECTTEPNRKVGETTNDAHQHTYLVLQKEEQIGQHEPDDTARVYHILEKGGNSNHTHVTDDYEEQQVTNDYHILMKEDQPNPTNCEANSACSPDIDDYDVSGNIPKRINESDNVYNNRTQFDIGDESDDTYNHTWGTIGNKTPHAKHDEHIYNTSKVTDDARHDPTYDHTGQSLRN